MKYKVTKDEFALEMGEGETEFRDHLWTWNEFNLGSSKNTKDIRDLKHTVESLAKMMKSCLVELSNVCPLIEWPVRQSDQSACTFAYCQLKV